MATWRFTISDTYTERAGAGAVEKLVQVLTVGAQNAPGRTAREIQKVLTQAAEHAGVQIPAPELRSIAGNLSLHDLETVVVSTDSDRILARVPVANRVAEIPMEERSDNVHLEPGHPDRPAIS